jgi:drug/metabolite transporter (DMT)-like permease
MVYLKLLMTAFFWGGTFISGRMLAQNVGPFSAAFLRFAVAAVCLAGLLYRREGRFPLPHAAQLLSVILLGLTGVFCYNVFFFSGLKLIEASRASVIIATNPIFITLFAVLIFGDSMTFLRAVGILLSVAGAWLVITRGQMTTILQAGLGPGELFIFGCVASWVAFSLLGKAVLVHATPLALITWSSIVGAACLLVPALNEDLPRCLHYSPRDWLNIFYLGVFGTVLGFVWYYEGIRTIGAVKAGLFINFVPISAVLLAYLILKEPLSLSLLAGAVLVSAGVYLVNLPTARRPRRNEP